MHEEAKNAIPANSYILCMLRSCFDLSDLACGSVYDGIDDLEFAIEDNFDAFLSNGIFESSNQISAIITHLFSDAI